MLKFISMHVCQFVSDMENIPYDDTVDELTGFPEFCGAVDFYCRT